MRVIFNGAPVSVIGQTVSQFILQLPNSGFLMVPMEQCEFECESALDWVQSEAWLRGVSFEDFKRGVR